MGIFYKQNHNNPNARTLRIFRVVLLFIVIYTFLPDLAAGNSLISRQNGKEKEKWLTEAKSQIKNFGPEKCSLTLKPSITEVEGFYQQSYRLHESGCIFFENGDWIFFVSHSSHSNAEVGDITLAMDSHKQFYKNEGHVCGGLIHFITQQKTELKSAAQFFELFVSDTDNKIWEKL